MSQVAPQAPTAAAPTAAPHISFPCGQCNRKPFGSKAAVRAHRRDKHRNNQQAPPQRNAQPRPTSVLPIPRASSSTYTPYIPLGAPVPWTTTPAPAATKPKKSKSRKKEEAKTSAEPSPTPAARALPNVRFVPRRDFEYHPDPDDSYYRGGGNRRMNPHTGRTMYLDIGQDWGLCDKECGWCGHCMDGLDI